VTVQRRSTTNPGGPTIWETARMRPQQPLTITERYIAWRNSRAGETVFHEAAKRASRLRDAGIEHYGIGAIAESIRFDRSLQLGRDDEGFKLNNNFRALLARELMEAFPGLYGFFETRTRKSL
jgi:hypothetical protein